MREHVGSVRWIVLSGLIGCVVLCAGCPGLNTSTTNAILSQLLEDLGLGANPDAVTIRIVNRSAGLTEQLDVRIDGVLQTFTCAADQDTCNFALSSVPTQVEAVEERRLDEDGAFRGGRVFSGQAGFTFTQDDFGPGSVVVFELSENDAQAFVL